jgi:hypothetical protein
MALAWERHAVSELVPKPQGILVSAHEDRPEKEIKIRG